MRKQGAAVLMIVHGCWLSGALGQQAGSRLTAYQNNPGLLCCLAVQCYVVHAQTITLDYDALAAAAVVEIAHGRQLHHSVTLPG